MNYIILIVLFLTSNVGLSQTFSGKYASDHGHINFISDTTLEFNIKSRGIIFIMYGYGKYKIIDNKIEVATIKHPSKFSSQYKITDTLSEQHRVEIFIENQAAYPISYCNLILKEKTSKKIII